MTVRFNKKLYTAKAIKRALSDFKELADFYMTDRKDHYLVGIKNPRGYPPETIKDELGNYILQLMRR
jgi:hypothetical protein